MDEETIIPVKEQTVPDDGTEPSRETPATEEVPVETPVEEVDDDTELSEVETPAEVVEESIEG
jgi:hypothetical protein